MQPPSKNQGAGRPPGRRDSASSKAGAVASSKAPAASKKQGGSGRVVLGVAGAVLVLAADVGTIVYLRQADGTAAVADLNRSGAIAKGQPGAASGGGAVSASTTLSPGRGGRGAWQPLDQNGPEESRAEPGEIIVINPPAGFAGQVQALGYSIIDTTQLAGIGITVTRLRIPSGTPLPQGRQQLAARFPGLTLDYNHLYEPQQAPPASQAAALPRALIGWRKDPTPTCGAGVILGMIAAGVDTKHPALANQDVEFVSFHQNGREAGPDDHGTAVAAILIGSPAWGGLLPGAKLKAAGMFELNETGKPVGSALGLLKGLNWLADNNVHAVNLSIAGDNNKAVELVIERATKRNLVLIAAAGNWGSDVRKAYPAAFDSVVAVTAYDTQKAIYKHANRGSYIDFAAPGVDVYTATSGNGGKVQSGTSFASPFITVLLALHVYGGQPRDPDLLRSLLLPTAEDLGTKGRDVIFGWGSVALEPRCR